MLLIREVGALDEKLEGEDLSIQEASKRGHLLEDFWTISRRFESRIHQKSRVTWVEGR